MNKNFTLQSLFNQQSTSDSLLEKSLKGVFQQDFDNLKPTKRSMRFLIDFAATFDCFNTKTIGNIEKLMN
ncbi:MAG: hypothetical protein K8F24_11875 [Bacteroidales bacterium]|nr:hypothetical protein [Bacteroidales bacterium]